MWKELKVKIKPFAQLMEETLPHNPAPVKPTHSNMTKLEKEASVDKSDMSDKT